MLDDFLSKEGHAGIDTNRDYDRMLYGINKHKTQRLKFAYKKP